jgi:hypothetical protein
MVAVGEIESARQKQVERRELPPSSRWEASATALAAKSCDQHERADRDVPSGLGRGRPSTLSPSAQPLLRVNHPQPARAWSSTDDLADELGGLDISTGDGVGVDVQGGGHPRVGKPGRNHRNCYPGAEHRSGHE